MNGRLWDHRRWPGVPHHSETRPAGAVGVSATTDPAPNSFPGCPAAWCKWPACGRDCPEKAANLSHVHHRIMERRRPARPRPRPLSRRSTPDDREQRKTAGTRPGARVLLWAPRGNTSQTRSDLKRRGPNPAPAILIGGGVRFSFPSPALSERCHRSLVRCHVSRGDYPVLKVPGAPILVPLGRVL